MNEKQEIYNELQSIYAILPAEEFPDMFLNIVVSMI